MPSPIDEVPWPPIYLSSSSAMTTAGAVVRAAGIRTGAAGCVDDQRHAELAADPGDFADRKHFKLRVGQCLGVVAARFGVGGAAEILGIGRIDKAHLDPHGPHHRVQEQVPGTAIEVGRADEIVAGLRDVVDAEHRGCLAGAERQCRNPPSSAATRCSSTSLVGFMMRE